MQMTWKDRNAIYEADHNGMIRATIYGDKALLISADSFIAAQELVSDIVARREAKKQAEIEAAWKKR